MTSVSYVLELKEAENDLRVTKDLATGHIFIKLLFRGYDEDKNNTICLSPTQSNFLINVLEDMKKGSTKELIEPK